MSDTLEIPDTLPHTPIDPNQPAEPNLITWDRGAIYTSYDGSWGKTPRMTVYWNDIADDGSTRFLVCNKQQELSSVEKERALKNLGIQPATTTTFGLVRYTDNWQDTGSGDPGYYPVTLTRTAIVALCNYIMSEYSYTMDIEIYGKCADVYEQTKEAADLAVSASEAAEGFAGEIRTTIAGADAIYEDMLEAEKGAVIAYEGSVDAQESAEGFANDARKIYEGAESRMSSLEARVAALEEALRNS